MIDDDRDALDPELEEVRRAVRDMDEVRADAAFRSRLRQQFVSGTIDQSTEPGQSSSGRWVDRLRAWMLLPAAAVVVAVVVALVVLPGPAWEFRRAAGSGSVFVDGDEIPVAAHSELSSRVRSGVHLRVTGDVTLDLLVDDTLILELAEGADATVPAAPRRGSVMTTRLAAGELRIRTARGFAGLGLEVTTAEGTIELTGTVISVFKGAEFTCVCVFEGTARIGKGEATMEGVSAGLRKVMFADDRPSMVIDIEPHHRAGLVEFLAATRDDFD